METSPQVPEEPLSPRRVADVRETRQVVVSVVFASGAPSDELRRDADLVLERFGQPPLDRTPAESRCLRTPEELAPCVPVNLREVLARLIGELAGDDPLRRRVAHSYVRLWGLSSPRERPRAPPTGSIVRWLVGRLPRHDEIHTSEEPPTMNRAYRDFAPAATVAPSATSEPMRERVARIQQEFFDVVAAVDRVLIGKRDVLERVLCAMAARGHVLLVDAPGVGKTLLCKAVSVACGAQFGRVQLTPDLLPMDLTGGTTYDTRKQEFVFRPGPIFASFLLVDEINRATPKTQSALLEVMEERTVTVDGTTHRLPEPFQVLATMNPLDHDGTFALPAAQIDRFMVMLELGHPSADDEVRVLDAHLAPQPVTASVSSVITQAQFVEWQRTVPLIHAAPTIKRKAVDLVHSLRRHAASPHAVSPRATVAWMRAAQARAMFSGREFVTIDDLLDVSAEVMRHRLSLSPAEVRDRLRSVSVKVA